MKRRTIAIITAFWLGLMAASPLSASPIQGLKAVGSGSMDWLFFTLYDATLYSPSGRYQAQQYPLALQIEYRKNIASEDLVIATKEQWQHLGLNNPQQSSWLAQLAKLWPDVKEGDVLTFVADSSSEGRFYFNQRLLGQVEGGDFATSFIAIWLSEQTSRPSLRKQLIGAR
ncbi:chalcone isomerase family protein [Motilimonas sp. KMU-193]|uniref:chalcone isomerase family protein n=1 Tax=Motilimonas sp. KMU-193 TaxID=3388668 RepID=UPI00396B2771